MVIGDATVHLRDLVVRSPRGDARLTKLEATLLEFLATHRGETLSRGELLVRVWGYAPHVRTRAVDNTVSRLRRKIEVDPANPRWLTASRGGGYRLEATDEPLAPDNLPLEPDRFVGRAREVDEVVERLAGSARLVTLVGFGGIGKTRLAVRVARSTLAHHPGGVCFCDLVEARDPDDVVTSVARSLGVEIVATDAVEQVGRAIRSLGRCLVVLDNFEQVAAHAAGTLGRWLAAAPDAKLLVTSRAVLGLPEEQVYDVPPLSDADAADLFRVRRAEAGVTDGDEAPDALIAWLDGLPLAVELAARRSRSMDLGALAAGVGRRFDLLTSAGAGRHPRQATLRATLDWSWALCSPAERAALAQLAAFEGGFTVADAAAVVALEPGSPPVEDVVASLLDHSFLVRREAGRLDLLLTVRDHALEHLGTSDLAAGAYARHGAHYATLGTEAALSRAWGRDEPELRRRLVRDLPNLLAAARRALARGSAVVAICATRAAVEVTRTSGPSEVVASLLDGALALPGIAGADEILLRSDAAGVHHRIGRTAAGRDHAERAVARAREVGDRGLLARALLALGVVQGLGELDAAIATLQEAVAHARAAAEPVVAARVNLQLGSLLFEAGRTREALEPLEATRSSARRSRDRATFALSSSALGLAHLALGRPDEAFVALHAAVATARELDSRTLLASTIYNLARADKQCGRFEAALEACREALGLHRELGNPRGEVTVLGQLGNLNLELGRLPEAVACQQEALDIAREAGLGRAEAQTMANLASALTDSGDLDRAAELYGEAIRRFRQFGQRRSMVTASVNLSSVLQLQGDLARSREVADAAHEGARALGEPRPVAMTLERLAQANLAAGRAAEAEGQVSEALRTYRALGDPRMEAMARVTFAEVLRARGEAERAAAEGRAAVALARGLADAALLATALCAVAEAELDRGERDAARRLVYEVEDLLRQGSTRRAESPVLQQLERVRRRVG